MCQSHSSLIKKCVKFPFKLLSYFIIQKKNDDLSFANMLLKPACSALCVRSWFNTTVTVGLVHHSHSGGADDASWELVSLRQTTARLPCCGCKTLHARSLEIRQRRAGKKKKQIG